MILASQIGSKTNIPGWPTADIDGLFDAMGRWPLDKRMNLSGAFEDEDALRAPFRGPAWGHCEMVYSEKHQKRMPKATKPIYPEHPGAVRFCGNFQGHSFGFWFDTEDKDLIARMDAAIAENLAKFH